MNIAMPLTLVIMAFVTIHRDEYAHDTIYYASAGAGCITTTKRTSAKVIYHGDSPISN